MRIHRPLAVLQALATVALAGWFGPALAEGSQDNFWGRIEYFFPTISSTARLDAKETDREGVKLSLEDDLDLSDRKGTPYILLGMRLGQSWRLEFEYYQLNRSATVTSRREIDWGDVHYDIGAELDSKFDTSVYRLVGGYSFYRTPQAEAGVALGLHVTQFKVGLAGEGTGPNGFGFQREDRDTLVPLPTIGVYGNYAINDQWRLNGRIDYLGLSYDDYDGRLINSVAAIEWRFVKNWGLGAGFRYVDYKLDAAKDKLDGEVNYRFKGPTLYVEGAF